MIRSGRGSGSRRPKRWRADGRRRGASPAPDLGCARGEGPGWREFSQFMADHVFGYKDRYEFLAVVHRKGLAEQFGGNGGSTRPGLDNRFTASGILSSHLFQKTFIDERTLLD